MRETYYWCLGLDECYEKFMRESMSELRELMSRPPLTIQHSFSELPQEERESLESIINKQNHIQPCLLLMAEHLRSIAQSSARPNLSILCSPESKIAQLARKQSPEALWGFSNADPEHPEGKCGWCSATYELGNKFILWHETLHVLGADDCHDCDRNPGPTCGCKNCIMRYVPTPESVGEWPFLCKENLDRIQRRTGTGAA